jgi:hypothetical protein
MMERRERKGKSHAPHGGGDMMAFGGGNPFG